MYKQPIIVFGIVLPALLAAVTIGACVFAKGKVTNSYESKSRNFEGYSVTIKNTARVEAELVKQREDSERWEELLSQEPFSLVTTNLRLIGDELPSKEFQRTAFERLGNSSGIGQATAQKSTGIRFNLRGTYRAVQEALLELETRMPNLQLQSLAITPNEPSETSLLNFQVIYTVWEK